MKTYDSNSGSKQRRCYYYFIASHRPDLSASRQSESRRQAARDDDCDGPVPVSESQGWLLLLLLFL